MSPDPAHPVVPVDRMDRDDSPPLHALDDDENQSSSEDEADEADDHDAPADLMVVSRARRSNAGNRMSTLLAKQAQEEAEEWGEEWEEAPNEEEFVGNDANDQDDFNLDSSSSDDEPEGDDDDAGEKELRKAERQERTKKRKQATNPFTARLAAVARKRVKLDVPSSDTQAAAPSRPKKKSERASWIPTPEDGPTRTSARKQTVANKEQTLAKLKEKDKRRDDTLAMMKAAEARKAKDEPKALTQAERLAEAARVEKSNSKSLHRWEEAEEQRAAERQAKLDALKNRQIDGPFIRYYSGPAIWVDDKLKFTGKDAPKIEELEEKLNKDIPSGTDPLATQSGTVEQSVMPDQPEHNLGLSDQAQTGQSLMPHQAQLAPETSPPQEQSQGQLEGLPQHAPALQSPQAPQVQTPQAPMQEQPVNTHAIPGPSSATSAPSQTSDSMPLSTDQPATEEQAANPQQPPVPSAPQQDSQLPNPLVEQLQNGVSQTTSTQPDYSQLSNPSTEQLQNGTTQATSQAPSTQPDHSQLPHLPAEQLQNSTSQATSTQLGYPPLPPNPYDHQSFQQPPFSTPHPPTSDASLSQNMNPQSLPLQPQQPPAPPSPPRKKEIRRVLRNLLILSSFPNLDAPPSLARARTTSSIHKDKDRSALIQLSSTLFGWNNVEATNFVTAMLNAPKTKKEREGYGKVKKELCAVTNREARYRDPSTGIAYYDRKAFQVLRGVVGGGFVWSGALGCYVGGRAKTHDTSSQGVKPAKGVPKRFMEMFPKPPAPPAEPSSAVNVDDASASAPVPVAGVDQQKDNGLVKTEDVVMS
jgi:vacuolar protein sorting-associated protein 72